MDKLFIVLLHIKDTSIFIILGDWKDYQIWKKSNFDQNQLKLSTQHKYMYRYQKTPCHF